MAAGCPSTVEKPIENLVLKAKTCEMAFLDNSSAETSPCQGGFKTLPSVAAKRTKFSLTREKRFIVPDEYHRGLSHEITASLITRKSREELAARNLRQRAY